MHFSDTSIKSEHKDKLISDIEQKLRKESQSESLTQYIYANEKNGEISPVLEYENLRRRIRSNTNEFWYFVNSELTKVWQKAKPFVPELGQHIDDVMVLAAEHKRSLVNDIDKVTNLDGYEKWRRAESEALSGLVQRRLTSLQNPKDCGAAKKLVCRLNKV